MATHNINAIEDNKWIHLEWFECSWVGNNIAEDSVLVVRHDFKLLYTEIWKYDLFQT